MKKEQLTMIKALKYARHDFLNDLQLILMHIDLGKTSDAKQSIVNTTEKFRQLSILERLGLPETTEWISTFEWMYSAFSKTLICDIEPGIRQVEDESIAKYLEQIFGDIEKILEPTSDYEAHFDVRASSLGWTIQVTVNGALTRKPAAPETKGSFQMEEKASDNQWTFTLSGQ